MERRYISKVKPLSQYILQVDFVSCVFVPEGTVPGWAVDTEIGNGEFSDIAGIWMEMRMQLQRC